MSPVIRMRRQMTVTFAATLPVAVAALPGCALDAHAVPSPSRIAFNRGTCWSCRCGRNRICSREVLVRPDGGLSFRAGRRSAGIRAHGRRAARERARAAAPVHSRSVGHDRRQADRRQSHLRARQGESAGRVSVQPADRRHAGAEPRRRRDVVRSARRHTDPAPRAGAADRAALPVQRRRARAQSRAEHSC